MPDNAQHFHVTGVCIHCGSPKFLGIETDRNVALEYMDKIPNNLREMEEIKEEIIARRLSPEVLEITMGEHRTFVLPVGCFDDIRQCQQQYQMYMMSLQAVKIFDEIFNQGGNIFTGGVPTEPEPFVDKSADILKGFDFPIDSGNSPEVN